MDDHNSYILKTSELSAGYERKIIVDGVNLCVRSGEILCLIGPNGSGKSTILKTITRELGKLGGKIFVLGKNLEEYSDMESARHLSMVMTEKIRPEYMTCREVIESARYPYTGYLGLLSEHDKAIVEKAIKTVEAEELSEKLFGKVSDGQKQRIMLARAIAQETEIIVLDEPTSFLDMRYKIDLIRIINSLAKNQKKAVITSLHELDLVKILADRVLCLGQGKIIKSGKPEEIFCGNFIQKLYGIRDEEFEPESARLKINFERTDADKLDQRALRAASEPAEGVVSNEVRARGRLSPPKIIMIQGTMSSAGKSLLVAGLCRILKQDGWKVAPFKSQNMALNSYVTRDGYEMGRAQVMQAEAAGLEASVLMNPVLLKPTSDKKSQVIVKGKVVANMEAREYFSYKKSLVPQIMEAFNELSEGKDVIVIEGAGSPAEINLRENDIVNMGLAEMVDAPVLLVGDIDRGGVFAQLLGTLELLTGEEKARVKGLIINKFRGDASLLDSGIIELEKRAGIPVKGVVPYMKLSLDDEDSLTERFEKAGRRQRACLNICVIRLPHISNFSDFSVFETFEGAGLSLSYIDKVVDLKNNSPDMIILPGSKNTIGDLRWLKEAGIADAVCEYAGRGGILVGICGGFQMLGEWVSDPAGIEVESGSREQGLSLLKMTTELESEKITSQVRLKIDNADGFFVFLNGKTAGGYEIHAGKSCFSDGKVFDGAVLCGENKSFLGREAVDNGSCNVMGTYIHGFFDEDDIASGFVKALCERRGLSLAVDNGSRRFLSYKAFKESQYDLLAETLRKSLDIKSIYKILGLPGKKETKNE